jgi:pilus assembly protein CpaB
VKIRRVQLIIGLVLALGTGVLLVTYLTSLRSNGTPGQTEAVLVATHDIPARAATTSDLFTVQQRFATQVDPDAISNPKELAGNYTLVAIPAGSVATRSKIGLAAAATLPAKLPIGMRAVSIAIDNVKGVAGLITPGDRVDVIADPAGVSGETPHGFAIVRGALVLAMGSDLETRTAAPPGPINALAPSPTTITLALTPNQVDLLVGADMNSTLRLALRNPKEPTGAFPAEVLKLASQGSTPANAAAATVPASIPANPAAQQASSPSSSGGVIVIDGDRVISGSTPPR